MKIIIIYGEKMNFSRFFLIFFTIFLLLFQLPAMVFAFEGTANVAKPEGTFQGWTRNSKAWYVVGGVVLAGVAACIIFTSGFCGLFAAGAVPAAVPAVASTATVASAGAAADAAALAAAIAGLPAVTAGGTMVAGGVAPVAVATAVPSVAAVGAGAKILGVLAIGAKVLGLAGGTAAVGSLVGNAVASYANTKVNMKGITGFCLARSVKFGGGNVSGHAFRILASKVTLPTWKINPVSGELNQGTAKIELQKTLDGKKWISLGKQQISFNLVGDPYHHYANADPSQRLSLDFQDEEGTVHVQFNLNEVKAKFGWGTLWLGNDDVEFVNGKISMDGTCANLRSDVAQALGITPAGVQQGSGGAINLVFNVDSQVQLNNVAAAYKEGDSFKAYNTYTEYKKSENKYLVGVRKGETYKIKFFYPGNCVFYSLSIDSDGKNYNVLDKGRC